MAITVVLEKPSHGPTGEALNDFDQSRDYLGSLFRRQIEPCVVGLIRIVKLRICKLDCRTINDFGRCSRPGKQNGNRPT